jgi:hypothetical protein
VDTSWWYQDPTWDYHWAYLVCVKDTTGQEHYFYFRVNYAYYTPYVPDRILLGWEGKRTDEQLYATIEQYRESYLPVDYGVYQAPDHVVINTDYSIASCRVASTAIQPGWDIAREMRAYESPSSYKSYGTEHQLVLYTYEYFHKWDPFRLYGYLVEVTDTQGVVRYYYFRVNYEIFHGTVTFPDIPASNEHILEAWTGDYSKEKHNQAADTYRADYTPIDYGEDTPVFDICFDVDFIPSNHYSYTTNVYGVFDDTPGMEPNRAYLLAVAYATNGNRVYVETDSFVGDEEVVAYLVELYDQDGVSHYYYFRVDYSVCSDHS